MDPFMQDPGMPQVEIRCDDKSNIASRWVGVPLAEVSQLTGGRLVIGVKNKIGASTQQKISLSNKKVVWELHLKVLSIQGASCASDEEAVKVIAAVAPRPPPESECYDDVFDGDASLALLVIEDMISGMQGAIKAKQRAMKKNPDNTDALNVFIYTSYASIQREYPEIYGAPFLSATELKIPRRL